MDTSNVVFLTSQQEEIMLLVEGCWDLCLPSEENGDDARSVLSNSGENWLREVEMT